MRSLKNLTFRGGSSQKTDIEGGCLEKGAWTVCRLRGAWQDRGGVVGNGATQDTFLKSQGKFFLLFLYTLFYIFLTPKNYKSSL